MKKASDGPLEGYSFSMLCVRIPLEGLYVVLFVDALFPESI